MIMNKKLCLAKKQKSTETAWHTLYVCIEKHFWRIWIGFRLGQGRFSIMNRTDMTSIKFISIMMITNLTYNMKEYYFSIICIVKT